MRILTLTQPYATLIAQCAKRIETRSWSTEYRGPLAIHAGQGLGPVGGHEGLVQLLRQSPFFEAFTEIFRHTGFIPDYEEIARALPRGAIVAVGDLVHIVATDQVMRDGYVQWDTPDGRHYEFEMNPQEYAFGDYAPGRYAWFLADVQRIDPPLPARGGLGLRTVSPEIEREVRKRREATR